MKRRIASLLLLCAVVICWSAGPSGGRAQTAAGQTPAAGVPPAGAEAMHGGQTKQREPGQKLAEEQFKNIQVLKGIPADQLMPAMQFISASLGVDCEYCPDHQAMDSDDKKPKKVARQMMTMMFDIDKSNFDGRLAVPYYSCHRGAAKPVSIPVIKDEEVA